jgi:hypothetical protein
MAEVVQTFKDHVYLNGKPYAVQVAARPEGHIWEAWIEFAALDGSDVQRTPRETTQPNREAVAYWATGLSQTYLEGALRRAVEPPLRRPIEVMPEPLVEAPAAFSVPDEVVVERPVLDPFSVGAKGETLLRNELGALAEWHLRNIVRGYRLADESLDLERLSRPELIALIVSSVRAA